MNKKEIKVTFSITKRKMLTLSVPVNYQLGQIREHITTNYPGVIAQDEVFVYNGRELFDQQTVEAIPNGCLIELKSSMHSLSYQFKGVFGKPLIKPKVKRYNVDYLTDISKCTQRQAELSLRMSGNDVGIASRMVYQ